MKNIKLLEAATRAVTDWWIQLRHDKSRIERWRENYKECLVHYCRTGLKDVRQGPTWDSEHRAGDRKTSQPSTQRHKPVIVMCNDDWNIGLRRCPEKDVLLRRTNIKKTLRGCYTSGHRLCQRCILHSQRPMNAKHSVKHVALTNLVYFKSYFDNYFDFWQLWILLTSTTTSTFDNFELYS